MTEDTVYRIVCVPASVDTGRADDLFGECCECGVAVRFRPHVPRPNELVCLECFDELYSSDHEIKITAESWREVLDDIKRRRH